MRNLDSLRRQVDRIEAQRRRPDKKIVWLDAGQKPPSYADPDTLFFSWKPAQGEPESLHKMISQQFQWP